MGVVKAIKDIAPRAHQGSKEDEGDGNTYRPVNGDGQKSNHQRHCQNPPPPKPKKPEKTPTEKPVINVGRARGEEVFPDSTRPFFWKSIWAERMIRSEPKRALSNGPFKWAARVEPSRDPMMPGIAKRRTTRQSTLPALAWAQVLEMEVRTIIARLVPKDR